MPILREPPPPPSAYGYSSIAPAAPPIPPVRPWPRPPTPVTPVAGQGPPDLTGITDGSVGGPGYTGYGLNPQASQGGGLWGLLQSLFGAGQGTGQGMTGMLRGGGDGRDMNR